MMIVVYIEHLESIPKDPIKSVMDFTYHFWLMVSGFCICTQNHIHGTTFIEDDQQLF